MTRENRTNKGRFCGHLRKLLLLICVLKITCFPKIFSPASQKHPLLAVCLFKSTFSATPFIQPWLSQTLSVFHSVSVGNLLLLSSLIPLQLVIQKALPYHLLLPCFWPLSPYPNHYIGFLMVPPTSSFLHLKCLLCLLFNH